MMPLLVVVAIVTETGAENVPPLGAIVGVAAEIVNSALPTALLVMPVLNAIALTVCVLLTVNAAL